MRISIEIADNLLPAQERERLERRLRFHLTRYAPQIRSVSVGAGGQRCPVPVRGSRVCVRVSLQGARPVLVEDLESDLQSALDRAVERVARAVKQRLMTVSASSGIAQVPRAGSPTLPGSDGRPRGARAGARAPRTGGLSKTD